MDKVIVVTAVASLKDGKDLFKEFSYPELEKAFSQGFRLIGEPQIVTAKEGYFNIIFKLRSSSSTTNID